MESTFCAYRSELMDTKGTLLWGGGDGL